MSSSEVGNRDDKVRSQFATTTFELQEQRRTGSTSPVPNQRSTSSYNLESLAPKLRLSHALLLGSAITAGTTYALVKHVQHLIANAQVSSDPAVWIQKARDDGYGACCNGCDDCHDVSFAYNACEKTSRAIVPGINCNGTSKWNCKCSTASSSHEISNGYGTKFMTDFFCNYSPFQGQTDIPRSASKL